MTINEKRTDKVRKSSATSDRRRKQSEEQHEPVPIAAPVPAAAPIKEEIPVRETAFEEPELSIEAAEADVPSTDRPKKKKSKKTPNYLSPVNRVSLQERRQKNPEVVKEEPEKAKPKGRPQSALAAAPAAARKDVFTKGPAKAKQEMRLKRKPIEDESGFIEF